MTEEKRRSVPYSELSEQARRQNIDSATRYNKNTAIRISLKTTKAKYIDIENYMNKSIAQGKSKSKNDFLLSAIRYAIGEDFKGIEK